MARKLKGLIVIISIGMLIYLGFSAQTLVAEDAENKGSGQFAGAMVSVEALMVVVEREALEEMIGDSDMMNLSSIPIEKIMHIVREEEGGEIFSSVKLSMKNDSHAEIEKEGFEEVNRKNAAEEKSEQESREIQISFEAMSHVIDIDKIEISFDFEQVESVKNLGSTMKVEEQEDRTMNFKMSSIVVLQPGRARIVGATMKDEAMFLIMVADI
jgi:hypothetical protein